MWLAFGQSFQAPQVSFLGSPRSAELCDWVSRCWCILGRSTGQPALKVLKKLRSHRCQLSQGLFCLDPSRNDRFWQHFPELDGFAISAASPFLGGTTRCIPRGHHPMRWVDVSFWPFFLPNRQSLTVWLPIPNHGRARPE